MNKYEGYSKWKIATSQERTFNDEVVITTTQVVSAEGFKSSENHIKTEYRNAFEQPIKIMKTGADSKSPIDHRGNIISRSHSGEERERDNK